MSQCAKYLLVFVILSSDLFFIGKFKPHEFERWMSVFYSYIGANGETKITDAVNDHLEKGKQLLATGQLSDAITHFHAAVGKMEFSKIKI